MGIKKEEEYFPRGRSASTKPALRKAKDTLFKKYKKPKKKNKKNSFYEAKQSQGQSKKVLPLKNNIVIRPLTYQSLEEGMVVLGRVREILPYHMFLCLPGRLSAKVLVAAISAPYTEALAQFQGLIAKEEDCLPLSGLFRIGQLVVCYVNEVKKDGDVLAVSVSLEPALVNKERAHYSVRAGHVIVAAVQSIEDHGYTLHTGISGLTAFLHGDKTVRYVEHHNRGRALVVGEVLRCLITKCTTGKSTSKIEVTVDPDSFNRAALSDVNTQVLHPATSVHCTVEQMLSSGLVVNVGKGKGYIETSQLTNCWSLPKQYKPKAAVTATVLYVLPHTDFQNSCKPIYLTLKDVNMTVTPKIGLGEVIPAKVVSSSSKGVLLCLGAKKDNEIGNKGFVSIRRLGDNVVKENIAVKYPKGKEVTTRILAFDYMEQLYNCSLERDKLEQQYVKVDQLNVGDRITCEVTDVDDSGLKLALGHIRLYAFKEHLADVPYANIYEHFAVGDIVDGRVLKVMPELRQVRVTLKETLIRTPVLSNYEAAHVGDCYWGTIRKISKDTLVVIFYNNVIGLLRLGERHQLYTVGQLVKCYITYVNAKEERMLLSLTTSQPQKPKQLQVGNLYELVVSNVHPDHLVVSVCDYIDINGIVPKCHLPDRDACKEGDFVKAWLYQKRSGKYHFSPNPAIQDFLKVEESIELHQRITCCVANVDSNKIAVYTSVPGFPIVEILKKKWPRDGHVELHQILHTFVKYVNKKNRSLVLTCREPATPMVSNENCDAIKNSKNSSESLTDVLEKFPVKKIKKAKIEHSKSDKNGDKNINENDFSNIAFENDLKKQKHSNSEDGLDASVDNTTLSKKKPKKGKEVEKSMKSQSSKTYEKSDVEKNKCQFALKEEKKELQCNIPKSEQIVEQEIKNTENDVPSAKTNRKMKPLEENSNKKDLPENETVNKPLRNVSEVSVKKSAVKRCSHNDDSDSEEDSNQKFKKPKKEQKLHSKKSKNKDATKLTLSESGFLWDVKPEDLNKPVEESVEDSDEGVENSGEIKKKKTPAERRRAAKDEEARLRVVEQTLLDSESNPQSVDQFDRAVLARPDDADLWIKYMSHHLQATEIDKGRAVARRALQTINQRHDVERLNVWIALLNLENLFGTQDSLKNCLDEALRTNDEFTVYCKMLQIYSQANKAQEAEYLVNTMLRKFRNSSSCWVHCCTALMKCELPDKARSLLQRAITALPNKEHVNLLCKFALLENQYGFSEQAQTLFEHILTSYPKRTDVWNVYVDMLVKSNKTEVARQILERATKQKLPARKMKMLFTKWISFEEKHGTPEKVDHVRKQALAYVNNVTMKLE